jgi:GNAT superfamily N-acetyltransferase
MSNLLAPNGKPSNLTPEQYKLVRTPEFKAWFGDWENQYKSTLIKSIDGRLIFDGKDIGIFEITKKSKSVEIDRLYIDKELQGKGIGKACIQYLFNNYEIDLVELYPHPYTQSFWLKNGVVNVSKDGFFEIDNKKYSVSKVVDENGEPLVVYHGTKYTDKYYNFDLDIIDESRVKAFFFSSGYEHAKRYTYGIGYIREFFINIRRLFDPKSLSEQDIKSVLPILNENLVVELNNYNDDNSFFDELKNQYGINEMSNNIALFHVLTKTTSSWQIIEQPSFQNYLIEKGYEGFKTSEQSTLIKKDNENFAVYSPQNIKLADGTNTTFDGNNLDIRFEDGGLIGNTYTQIIYRAILSTETTTDIYAQGEDLAKIKSEYNSISADDFDNPNSRYNSKILESITNQFEFIGDDSLSAEDYIDNLEDTNYWDLVDEESNEIESDLVSSINKNTDEMIDEIREFIKEEYNIGGRYAEKYMTISVEDENEDFIADLNIRTADHSQNSRNNDNTSYNLSFVIANKNATEGRFIPLGEQYYYDDNANIEDIKMEIKGIIDDKIEVIKDKQRFSNGGSIKELSKKEKQIVIENQNKVFSDVLPMYKLSADGKWVMKLNSRTNKYNTHNRFDLFHEGILDREREAYARENAKKVFEYLDNNGAELLNKSIYGSRYYIYKNNHIRVSNHHNQSEQTNKETGLSKYKSNEHNFYSYEKDGWKEMINKIELINPDIRFNEGGSVLLAPNGKPSNLTPEQYKLVRSQPFISWFGDWEKLILTKINDSAIDEVSLKRLEDGVSKVVDENGEPLVVYHGTSGDFFYEFMPYAVEYENGKSKRIFRGNRTEKEFDEYIYKYGLRKVIPTFWFSDKISYGNKQLHCFLNIKNILLSEDIRVQSKPLPKGIEGVKIPQDDMDYYFVTNSNQIKLADGTNTTFDSNNPDIRFDGGGIVNFVNSKSLTIKIGGDLYKVQYRRNELGDTDKKVWFADVVSKNGEIVEYGRLSYDGEYTNVIYGFSLLEVENDIIDTFKNNDLYLITQDDYGLEVENRHIEFSNDSKKTDIRFDGGGKIELNEESQQLVDIISMNPNSDKYQKYKDILLNKFGINFDDYYKDDYYIENANLSDIKRKDDFVNYDKYIEYAKKIFKIRGLFNDYHAQNIEGIITIDEAKEIGDKLDFKIINQEYSGGAENYASHSIDVITIPNEVDINTFVHEIGHHYDHFESKEYEGLANTSTYASSLYEIGKSDEVFAENFKNYFIAPKWLKEKLPMVYSELDTNINEKYKKVILKLIDDIKQKYNYGGQPINKETMNPKDTITMDIPLLIRMLEVAREDIKSDEQLHRLVENVLDLKDNLLTMDDYDEIVMGIIGNEGDKVAEPIENDLYSKVNDLKEHPELLKYFLKHGGQTTEQSNKISKVMHEFNEGKLKTSYGEIVTDPKQAIAIALSEAGIQKEMEEGGIIEGQLHSECNDEEGCGEKFEVGQGGNTIEAERDEAVIVSEAFDNNNKYTIHGNCSQIASALNIIGGGKNFDKGASIMSADGKKLSFPQMKSKATNTDVERQLEGGSIIINRRSMADPKKYTITGTTRQIASAINSMNNNGVVIEAGAEVE